MATIRCKVCKKFRSRANVLVLRDGYVCAAGHGCRVDRLRKLEVADERRAREEETMYRARLASVRQRAFGGSLTVALISAGIVKPLEA